MIAEKNVKYEYGNKRILYEDNFELYAKMHSLNHKKTEKNHKKSNQILHIVEEPAGNTKKKKWVRAYYVITEKL